jgi:hypothetical protein
MYSQLVINIWLSTTTTYHKLGQASYSTSLLLHHDLAPSFKKNLVNIIYLARKVYDTTAYYLSSNLLFT